MRLQIPLLAVILGSAPLGIAAQTIDFFHPTDGNKVNESFRVVGMLSDFPLGKNYQLTIIYRDPNNPNGFDGVEHIEIISNLKRRKLHFDDLFDVDLSAFQLPIEIKVSVVFRDADDPDGASAESTIVVETR